MKFRSSVDSEEFQQISRKRKMDQTWLLSRLEDMGAHYLAYSSLVGKRDWKMSLGILRSGSEVGIGMELE
jgi:hypothetical protein